MSKHTGYPPVDKYMEETGNELFSIKEVSEITKRSVSSLRNLYRHHDTNGLNGPSFELKRGRSVLLWYTSEDIDEILNMYQQLRKRNQ